MVIYKIWKRYIWNYKPIS